MWVLISKYVTVCEVYDCDYVIIWLWLQVLLCKYASMFEYYSVDMSGLYPSFKLCEMKICDLMNIKNSNTY